jgi:DNA repair and recombination RAD54-like protein
MNVKSYSALNSFNCPHRIILTGTPIQNDLNELFACVSFVNPKIFSNRTMFAKVFSGPIMKGLDKNCSAVEKNLSLARAKQLMETINPFILRRTGNILSKFLPAKHEYSVFIKMTPLQEKLYNRVIDSRRKGLLEDRGSESYGEIFSILTVLRKILNHPKLLSSIDSKYAQEAKGGLPENFWDEDLT